MEKFETTVPWSELSLIHNRLQGTGICFEEFFESGRVVYKTDRNASFIQKVRDRYGYRQLISKLPEMADLNEIGEDLLNRFFVVKSASEQLRDFIR